MAAPTTAVPAPDASTGPRANITARTLRRDRWWRYPASTAAVLLAFIGYANYAAWAHSNYYWKPYISPFYSPCLAYTCDYSRQGYTHHLVHVPNVGILGSWWIISPAIIILIVPLGFRLTCYYYRKAYYRAFWQSPPACAVAEPHVRYSGETRFPLIFQNVHRYFFYLGLILNGILTYDAVVSFRNHAGQWGHAGFGTLMLCVNAILLWLYSASCHSCRHIVGGRLKHFSRHPIRFKMWGVVSKLNAKHMQIAWVSLIFVALTDMYVRLVASGTIIDPRFF
ncbi:MAG TPA: hypothetical protein VKU91_01690 [Acidimicrobiales bacterium]|nr:hypothetical protein [Acidimicrobiales bacterium]